jgi:hypothetical protein
MHTLMIYELNYRNLQNILDILQKEKYKCSYNIFFVKYLYTLN